MPWLIEFGPIVARAARLVGHGPGTSTRVEPDGSAAELQRLTDAFPGGVRVDDPVAGRLEVPAILAEYLDASRTWLEERTARPRLIAVTEGVSRIVAEFEVDLTQGARAFSLPIGVVVEPARAAGSVWIRIYHSQWPLLGHHVVRPPLLPRDPSARESDVVGAYQRALAAGDAAGCVATFEVDGCFREPSGPEYRVCGTADLTAFYTRFFSAGGGIILDHCTVTEDGVRSALEFNAVRWGGTDLPPQAGLAVYERAPTGKIVHARVYDDVEGPVEE